MLPAVYVCLVVVQFVGVAYFHTGTDERVGICCHFTSVCFAKLQSDHAEVPCSHMGLFFTLCNCFHIFKLLGYPSNVSRTLY